MNDFGVMSNRWIYKNSLETLLILKNNCLFKTMKIERNLSKVKVNASTKPKAEEVGLGNITISSINIIDNILQN